METKKLHINTLEFSQKKHAMQGELLVRDLPRLQTAVLDTSSGNPLHYKLEGGVGALGLPGIRLQLEVVLQVICQRCLGEMPLRLQLELGYVISKDTSAELDDMDEVDWLEAEQNFDLAALIEDELLLALPIAPVHDFPCNQHAMASGEKPNPFAVLKGLKTSKAG